MSPARKRVQFAVMATILVLTACVPAPVPTQIPGLAQQLTEQSITLAAAATSAAEKDQQLSEQSDALAIASQTAPAIEQQPPTPSTPPSPTLDSTAQAVIATITAQAIKTQTAQKLATPTQTLQQPATLTEVPSVTSTTLASVESLTPFLSSGNEELIPCTYTITPQGGTPRELTVVRNPRLDLGIGDEVIIILPVNLRSGPALSDRILMTLRADPTYIAPTRPDPKATPSITPTLTPGSTATPNPNRIIYEIIGGPAFSNFGAADVAVTPDIDGTDAVLEYSPYSVVGRKYIWWQIQSRDKEITGWIVEASACGLYDFIEPVSSEKKRKS